MSLMNIPDKLTETERVIVSYIVDNPEETSRISARELARRTYTSVSSVLRISKKLGFENFNDLKVNIVVDLKQLPVRDLRIRAEDTALEIMKKITKLKTNVIAHVCEKTSPETLQEVASLIVAAKYVDIFARGTSAFVAEYAAHQFLAEGRMTNVWHDLDRLVYAPMMISPLEHVCIFMSRSGNDELSCHVAQQLSNRDIATVALTSNRASLLAQSCRFSFELPFSQAPHHLGNILFSTASSCLFDMLFALVLSNDFDGVTRFADECDELYRDKDIRGSLKTEDIN